MKTDFTSGNIAGSLLAFAAPMIAGNLLQQMYNIADTLIVGRYLGEQALAAVGSTYTLTTFLYSIIIGLCMGSGALVSYHIGGGDDVKRKNCMGAAFLLIGAASVMVQALTMCLTGQIVLLLKTPAEIAGLTAEYVRVILSGLVFIFLYNYYAYMLRAGGNSVVPLIFLGAASVINVFLDIVFVVKFGMGVKGAAYATLISQGISGAGLTVWSVTKEGMGINFFRISLAPGELPQLIRMSLAASVQQSVMNFGILMIQGLVNSFGTLVMAAFTVAVKIDTLAYMPAQEFGSAFSLFVSGNYGGREYDRIKKSVKISFGISAGFCAAVSTAVVIFSRQLMGIFVDPTETDIIAVGAGYLTAEGACYAGIGILFLLYGYYRGIGRPEMSLILTLISLGTRVLLAYLLSSAEAIGVFGIWVSIPIGWVLADIIGIIYMRKLLIINR